MTCFLRWTFAAVVLSACGGVYVLPPHHVDARTLRIQKEEIFEGGAAKEEGRIIQLRSNGTQSFSDIPPGELISSWQRGSGLPSNIDYYRLNRCGYAFELQGDEARFGRLLLYMHREDGQGPAGRGDYVIRPTASTISSATGGRLAVQYESYLAGGEEWYAWILYLSDRPIPCGCTEDTIEALGGDCY